MGKGKVIEEVEFARGLRKLRDWRSVRDYNVKVQPQRRWKWTM